MTSQDRVNRMFARQDHDRIPRRESLWPETLIRWQSEGLFGGDDEVMQLLDCDLHELNGRGIRPRPFVGVEKLIAQDELTRTIQDDEGKIVRYWKNKSGTPEHLGFGCDSRETWEKIYKPATLQTGLQIDPADVARRYRRGREKGKWCHFKIAEAFEQTRAVMGDETTMIAMAEDPDWIIDVSRTCTDLTLQYLDAAMATGIHPDGLWVFGDMAFKTATFCSPSMYKELIWPDHKRLADWAHAHRMKTIYHTDGNVNGVMDLYIAAGWDCIQPLESKAGMDVRNLCPKYGDKLAFMGNINAMVMSTNDLDQIENEIKTKFAAGKKTKGYAYHSDHSVPPQVSWKTYQAIIELIKKHGSYK